MNNKEFLIKFRFSALFVFKRWPEWGKRKSSCNARASLWYSKRDSNPHSRDGQGILSPSCLPFHHSSNLIFVIFSRKLFSFFAVFSQQRYCLFLQRVQPIFATALQR